jgi:hypothetical protein
MSEDKITILRLLKEVHTEMRKTYAVGFWNFSNLLLDAIELLEKGYSPKERLNELLRKYEDFSSIPPKKELKNASRRGR